MEEMMSDRTMRDEMRATGWRELKDAPDVVVPEGMRQAAMDGVVARPLTDVERGMIHRALIFALRWQRANPPVPSDEQVSAIMVKSFGKKPVRMVQECCVEWVRRMYDAPPETKVLAPCDQVSECDFCVLLGNHPIHRTRDGREWRNSAYGCANGSDDAPEPEVLEAIRDLLLPNIESGYFKPEIVNERMAECYRRGLGNSRQVQKST